MSWPLIGKIRRITYVIDAEGVVREIFTHTLKAAKHVADSEQTVKQLATDRT